MRALGIAVLVVLVLAALVAPQVLYFVDETDQVVITQFRRPVRTVTAPGIHVKMPFIQAVSRFEKRILRSDPAPTEYLTLDKKRVIVNHVSRWRIVQPLDFLEKIRTETAALSRLDDIIFSQLRAELAKHDLDEVIDERRETIMESVTAATQERLSPFGIEIVDVRIKRADLPEEVHSSVFNRMVAERQRIAKRYRSEGEEESRKIRGDTDREQQIILAEAYEKAQDLQGQGDARAAAIYAESFGRDPEFYNYVRSLEAYKAVIDDSTLLILPSDTALLQYLQSPDRAQERNSPSNSSPATSSVPFPRPPPTATPVARATPTG
ncbi:MAG: HflC protein [Dehalococcoidia bacterium]|nr:HflC protein [Dehalococcoidia bacterium]